MRLHLEGDSGEFLEKGPRLVRRLAAELGVDLEALARPEILAKAEPEPVHEPLKQMHAAEREIYADQIARMLREIGDFLDEVLAPGKGDGVQKAALLSKGFEPSDFEDGGLLQGLTPEELDRVAGGG